MHRTFTFTSLSPGTDFLISVVTTKGLKRSHPTVLMVSTCKFILYLIFMGKIREIVVFKANIRLKMNEYGWGL